LSFLCVLCAFAVEHTVQHLVFKINGIFSPNYQSMTHYSIEARMQAEKRFWLNSGHRAAWPGALEALTNRRGETCHEDEIVDQ